MNNYDQWLLNKQRENREEMEQFADNKQGDITAYLVNCGVSDESIEHINSLVDDLYKNVVRYMIADQLIEDYTRQAATRANHVNWLRWYREEFGNHARGELEERLADLDEEIIEKEIEEVL